jgi:hypothetical protein
MTPMNHLSMEIVGIMIPMAITAPGMAYPKTPSFDTFLTKESRLHLEKKIRVRAKDHSKKGG